MVKSMMYSRVASCRPGGLSSAIATVLSIILILETSTQNGAHARQSSQDQAQQNSIGELAVGGSGAAGDYPAGSLALALGADGGIYSGYLNNKRARKMSAFVPMRGRRDPPMSVPMAASNEQLPMFLGNLGDSDNEISLFRVLAANGLPVDSLGGPLAPRQFANQLVARHAGGAERFAEVAEEAPSSYLETPIMQAKLRRAFHPMRGKRLIGSSDPSTTFEAAAM